MKIKPVQLEKCWHLHVELYDVPRLVYRCLMCGVQGTVGWDGVFTPLESDECVTKLDPAYDM